METIKKTKFITFLALLSVASLFQANIAAAQATIGAQACMPANHSQATTMLWQAEGVLNNHATANRWANCAVAIIEGADSADVTTRVRNRSNTTATIKCQTKVVNDVGNVVQTLTNSRELTADKAASMTETVTKLDRGDSISVSCNLPPQFQIISITAESVD